LNESYATLYAQYTHCIAVQKDVIARYRTRLQRAQKSFNMAEVQRLNALLRILYEEKSELEERAVGLREYLQ